MQTLNILLTGYRGFIGKNLAKVLAPHNLTLVEWDSAYPRLSGFDWVLHIGAISSTSETNVSKVLQQNLVFSIELFESCIAHKVNFQWASSASVYGQTQHFREDGPVQPQSLYARSKYLLEQYILSRNAPIIYQGFRYFNVFGDGEEHKAQPSPYTLFKRQAQTLGCIKIFKGSEYIYRDFIPVSNVCKAHLQMLASSESGIWNIGSGMPRSFYEVARDIAEQYKVPIVYIDMPENIQAQYQYYTCADTSKLNTTLKNIDTSQTYHKRDFA